MTVAPQSKPIPKRAGVLHQSVEAGSCNRLYQQVCIRCGHVPPGLWRDLATALPFPSARSQRRSPRAGDRGPVRRSAVLGPPRECGRRKPTELDHQHAPDLPIACPQAGRKEAIA